MNTQNHSSVYSNTSLKHTPFWQLKNPFSHWVGAGNLVFHHSTRGMLLFCIPLWMGWSLMKKQKTDNPSSWSVMDERMTNWTESIGGSLYHSWLHIWSACQVMKGKQNISLPMLNCLSVSRDKKMWDIAKWISEYCSRLSGQFRSLMRHTFEMLNWNISYCYIFTCILE